MLDWKSFLDLKQIVSCGVELTQSCSLWCYSSIHPFIITDLIDNRLLGEFYPPFLNFMAKALKRCQFTAAEKMWEPLNPTQTLSIFLSLSVCTCWREGEGIFWIRAISKLQRWKVQPLCECMLTCFCIQIQMKLQHPEANWPHICC